MGNKLVDTHVKSHHQFGVLSGGSRGRTNDDEIVDAHTSGADCHSHDDCRARMVAEQAAPKKKKTATALALLLAGVIVGRVVLMASAPREVFSEEEAVGSPMRAAKHIVIPESPIGIFGDGLASKSVEFRLLQLSHCMIGSDVIGIWSQDSSGLNIPLISYSFSLFREVWDFALRHGISHKEHMKILGECSSRVSSARNYRPLLIEFWRSLNSDNGNPSPLIKVGGGFCLHDAIASSIGSFLGRGSLNPGLASDYLANAYALVEIPPLQASYSSIDKSGNKSTPRRPPYRILYGVVSIIASSLVAYRLLILGDNWLKPDWLNIPLLFAAFLCGMYGFSVLLQIAMEKFG
jgi:hypothetical protein